MDQKQFYHLRRKLQKTQKQMANLLGTSLRAIQSYEQGKRKVPVHIERQILFLMVYRPGGAGESGQCWEVRDCAPENRQACPAWEFKLGSLCWFINGTICDGKTQRSWAKKMKICQSCEVFVQNMNAQSLQPKGRTDIGPSGRGERFSLRARKKNMLS